MAKAATTTVAAYLKRLPPERRAVISRVRASIRRHLPGGYKEMMAGPVIAYVVPLSRYPDTYNGHPLWYVALTAQKHHYALYLMAISSDGERKAELRRQFEAAGQRLDMGQACVRFKRLDQLPLAVIGESVASIPLDLYVAAVDRMTKQRTRRK